MVAVRCKSHQAWKRCWGLKWTLARCWICLWLLRPYGAGIWDSTSDAKHANENGNIRWKHWLIRTCWYLYNSNLHMCTSIPLLSHGSLSLANGAYTSIHCAIAAGLPGQHPAKCKAGNSSWNVPWKVLPFPFCARVCKRMRREFGFRKAQTEKSIHIET